MKKALIIGGGFAGCAAAHQFEKMGEWETTLVEAAPFLGGGVRTQWHGGHPYTFGPRHFLTKNEKVFEYLDKIVPMRRCAEHEFLTYVEADQEFYQYPIHVDDIPRMPEAKEIERELQHAGDAKGASNLEEYWISSVGPTLYGKFVDEYSKKMWMLRDNTLIDDFGWSPKGVALKSGLRAAWDTAISAYPQGGGGYNPFFFVSTKRARVLLNTKITDFDPQQKKFFFEGAWHQFDVVVNTISPDLLFEQCLGALPYVGRDISLIVLPTEFALPRNVYFAYYAGKEKFTRITEYKKFTQHYHPGQTLISVEYPSRNGRYYPMPFKTEQARAAKYLALMPNGMFSIGRAGCYRYQVDIDDCIEQAMNMAEELK